MPMTSGQPNAPTPRRPTASAAPSSRRGIARARCFGLERKDISAGACFVAGAEKAREHSTQRGHEGRLLLGGLRGTFLHRVLLVVRLVEAELFVAIDELEAAR